MKPSEEKAFLYGMMKDITEERRALTNAYFSLKSRIDDLTKLEEKGIGELSTKGFIDLLNDGETQQTIRNMNREVEAAIARREQKDLAIPRYDKIAETLERGAEDRATSKHDEVARLKAKYEAEEMRETEERERDRMLAITRREKELAEKEQAMINRALQESQQVALRLTEENDAKKSEYTPVSTHIIPKQLIEQEKDKDKGKPGPKPKSGSGRQQGNLNSGLTSKEATFFIAKILKEGGTPLSIDQILERLIKASGVEIKKKNLYNNILRRATAADPRIEKAAPGFYQYGKSKE